MMEAATLGALEAGKPVAGIRIQARCAVLGCARSCTALCGAASDQLLLAAKRGSCAADAADWTAAALHLCCAVPAVQREAGTTVRTASYLPAQSQVFCRFLSSRKVALVDAGERRLRAVPCRAGGMHSSSSLHIISGWRRLPAGHAGRWAAGSIYPMQSTSPSPHNPPACRRAHD
jgi:hypothetical protein